MMERINSLMGNIGMGFLGLWNRRKLLLPLLFLATVVSWAFYIELFTLLTFNLAVTFTVLFFTILLLGTVVVDGIEAGFIPLEKVPRVVIGSLVAIGTVLLVLIYLALMLARVAPPLPLSFMFAILYAMEVAPLVSLAIVIPPVIGYFLCREKWRRLRTRVPFWGAYFGLLAALLCAYPILRYPELWFYWGMKIFATSGVLLVLSLLLLAFPREGTAKAVGLALPLVGFISWFTCFGGMTLGSVLAILGGACAFSWAPRLGREASLSRSPPEQESPPHDVDRGTKEGLGETVSKIVALFSDTGVETPREGSSRLMERRGESRGGGE